MLTFDPKWSPNEQFLSTLHAANPNLTGWPIWLVGTSFQRQEHRPYAKGQVWEQHVLVRPIPGTPGFGGAHWDFSVLDPAGRFFLRRILPDDFRCGQFYLRTKLSLDPPFQMSELTETLRTGQRFAEALAYEPSTVKEIKIVDSGKGTTSVADDLEVVLQKSEDWQQGSIAGFKIGYRDAEGLEHEVL
jgi:hypothetical protein